MATTANLSSIIRYYAEKQDSGFIDFRDFCAYIKKYAEHHVEEQAELVKYLGESSQTVAAELQGLADKKLAEWQLFCLASLFIGSIEYAQTIKKRPPREVFLQFRLNFTCVCRLGSLRLID